MNMGEELISGESESFSKITLKKYEHKNSSVVFIENEDRYLMNIYDNTYPIGGFRGNYHLLGGGYERGDSSPKYTLRRELLEEMNVELKRSKFLKEYQIYFSNIDSIHRCNVFQSEVDFDTIDKKIKRRERIINEGRLRILTKEDIKSGKIRGAWGHASIMGDILDISVPEYDWISLI